MRKITLNLDALSVETFETAAAERGEGTVLAHAKPPTYNGCGSEIDACPSARGCTLFGGCDTSDPALCPSADDACVSSRGCTVIGC
jgi:hypothetical protein